MPLGVLSLSPAHRSSRYRSNKALGYTAGIDGVLEGKCGSTRVRCAKARMRGSYGKKFFEFFLVGTGVRGRDRGTYMGEN